MGTLSRIAGKISIAALAQRRHGYVTRVQLLDAGLSSSAIGRRVASGALIPSPYIGVYAVGHVSPDPVCGAAAVVLACGRGAALSHASAAALWTLGRSRWKAPFHVTVAADCRRRGIRIHRVKTLNRRDVTTHRGIRATTPARTLLDIAPALTDRALTRAVNDALISNYLHESELIDVLERLPRHRGTHRTRSAFEDDRDRDAEMLRTGLPTVRVTRDRLVHDPAREAARLLAILRSRSDESLTGL